MRPPASSAITSTKPARDAGCTRAIWVISTRTAISSSSIARRISSRRAAIRCGRERSKRCWRRIRRWPRSASPASPTRSRGEAVKAWVVLRAGQTATEQELRAFCREQLAPYKVPSHIEFRTELPKTMVGKVLRRALRES